MKKVFVIILLGLLISGCTDLAFNNLQFESEKWKSSSQRTKGKMAYSLRDSKILIGKTEAEVKEHLGTAEYSDQNAWIYDIDSGLFWSYYFTVIFEEETKRVKKTEIHD